jgi:hypothetical protein
MSIHSDTPVTSGVRLQKGLVDGSDASRALSVALESQEVKSVTETLLGTIGYESAKVPENTPAACPGAPYRRRAPRA